MSIPFDMKRALDRLRGPTACYALIQGLYWAIFCLMVGFASAFLLDRGFTNGQIGMILGASYLLSAILQPVIGSVFSSQGIRLNLGIACMYLPVAALSLMVALLPLNRALLAGMLVIIFTIQSMMQPSVNALHQCFEAEGAPVNFGLARGVGSACYALSSFLMGRLLARLSPSILPWAYGIAVAALILVLFFAKTNAAVRRVDTERKGASYADILKVHPHVALFLIGAGCMFLTYSFIDNFLLQILLSIGGTSANLGTAITLSAMTELPAMILFSRFSRRGKGVRVFMISVWFWLAKDVLTLLAPNPGTLYAVQLLNFASCAVYVPGMMDYMRHALPEDQLLRGVTLAGTATTLGSLIATILGGWLMDLVGVRSALTLVQLFALTGAILLTLAFRDALKRGSAPSAA